MTKLNELRKLIIEMKTDIVTTDQVISLGFKRAWIKYALKSLVEDKSLFRVKKGIYLKINPENYDIFKLANIIYGGYIGLSSAAYIYGWIDEYQYTIFVLTGSKSGITNIGKHQIRSISIGEKFVGSGYYKNNVISTKAKTLFDILYLMNIIGEENAIKYISASDLSKNDWKEFIEYCLKFGSKSFRQKSGYILNKINKHVPESQKLMPKKPVVVKLGKGKPRKFDKKWMVIDCLL